VWAESGVNFGVLARLAAQRGLGGLEWAAGIPGTLGGAVVGNAGAHGGDVAGNLLVAEILHQEPAGGPRPAVRQEWPQERLGFVYRGSVLKSGHQGPSGAQRPADIVLAARLRLERSTPEAVQAKLDEFVAYRRRTQPPGASMGSMFKNPPGDYAGRLIDAAGLKGAQVGSVQISPVHGNFFINLGAAEAQASASDIYRLLDLARRSVADRFGVWLEPEIELVGDWSDVGINN
jgi:UDP-N-acetylmuramate dehydrogenase